MENNEALARFLADAQDVSIGQNTIRFLPLAELEAGQEQFRQFISSGYDLPDGIICEGFIVIATDDLGDPIYVDIDTPELVVSCAGEEEGSIGVAQLADSLENFQETLERLRQMSAGRTHPAALEQNPVPEADRDQFLAWFQQHNPDSDAWYWELFLE